MFGRRGRPWPREREGPAPQAWEGFTVPNFYALVIRGDSYRQSLSQIEGTDSSLPLRMTEEPLRMTGKAAQNDREGRS